MRSVHPGATQLSQEFEDEDPDLCPVNTFAYFAKFQQSATPTARRASPSIFIKSGFEIFQSWRRQTGIEEWNMVLAFDIHYVIDTFEQPTCVDLWFRILSMANVKFLVITYRRNIKSVGRVLERNSTWTWLLDRAAGIVITTDEESDEEVNQSGVTVTDPLGYPQVILMKGGKGDIIGALGVPGVLVDDRRKNLEHWVMRGPQPSTGILVPGRDWAQYNSYPPTYHWQRSILAARDPLAWIIISRKFREQCLRMGWGERNRVLEHRRGQACEKKSKKRTNT